MMNEADYIPKGSIYKYTSVLGAIATLENRSFKFNCPLDFNDPFDCNVAILEFSKTRSSVDEFKFALSAETNLSRRDKRQQVKRLNDKQYFKKLYDYVVAEKVRKSKVTCFSREYTNTLMWSHYADQHRGVCLEFNGSMERSVILDRGAA
jgi:hypothetical protein